MDNTLRVLILEDNRADAELVQFELEEASLNFTAKVVMTEQDFIHELDIFSPDIIISDYDLPRYTGAQALAEATKRCPDIPFILVTGAVTEDRAIEILTQGAKDYVLKSRLEQRLVPAVRRALAEAEEHQSRRKAEKELYEAYRSLEERVRIRTADLEAEVLARKKMEETQRLHAAVLETVAEGIFLIGLDDNIIKWANRKFEVLFGYDPGEVVGMHVDKVNAPTDKTPTENRISIVDVLQRDGEWHGEVKNIKKDGTQFWSYINVSLFDHPEFGKVMVSAHTDINERKQAEAALLENREQYRELLLNANSIIIRMDQDGVINFFNEYAQKFFGYALDEILGKDVRILVPSVETDGKNLEEMSDNILRNPDEFEENINENIKKNGERVWVLWKNKAIRDSDGNIIGILTVGNDITERKKIEEELTAAKTLAEKRALELEAVMRATPAIVFVTHDSEGREMTANRDTYDFLGVPLGRNVSKTAHQDEQPINFRAMKDGREVPGDQLPVQQAAQGHEIRDYEVDLVFTDGTKRTIFGNATPLKDADGNLSGALGVFIDITARKQAELELEKKASQLEAANKELESFSYSISHDLRAPLRAIEGYSKMILRRQGEKFDEETKRQLNVIRDSSKIMDQLINDLLGFSKLGKQTLDILPLDVRQLIEEVWRELQNVYPNRSMTLKIDPMPLGWGDRAIMKQVFVNILSNAIKYSRKREMAIIEVGGYENGNENEVVYYVKDNGVGFDMKYYDKLFGVFQRLHDATEYEGTGIGLALVQRIVHRHGGRIWAESKVDGGATFYFTLPREVKH